MISSDTAASSNAGKKSKKMKKVDASNLLGFRPAGDPSRFNRGEIDTAPPAPTKKGKRK
jgi:hypothetical protein